MIDLELIILFFVIYILYNMIPMIDEVKTIINLVLVSSMLFYITFSVNVPAVSKVFGILAIVTVVLIPVLIIIKYLEKITN